VCERVEREKVVCKCECETERVCLRVYACEREICVYVSVCKRKRERMKCVSVSMLIVKTSDIISQSAQILMSMKTRVVATFLNVTKMHSLSHTHTDTLSHTHAHTHTQTPTLSETWMQSILDLQTCFLPKFANFFMSEKNVFGFTFRINPSATVSLLDRKKAQKNARK